MVFGRSTVVTWVGAALFAAACDRPASGPVVVGFFDAGWPTASGKAASGIHMFVAADSGGRCAVPADSTITDSTGVFRLQAVGVRSHWRVCVGEPFLSGALHIPVYRDSTAAGDSVRLYCRVHGPS